MIKYLCCVSGCSFKANHNDYCIESLKDPLSQGYVFLQRPGSDRQEITCIGAQQHQIFGLVDHAVSRSQSSFETLQV